MVPLLKFWDELMANRRIDTDRFAAGHAGRYAASRHLR